MKLIMKNLMFASLVFCLAACSSNNSQQAPEQPVNNLGSIPWFVARFADSVTRLQKEQSACTDVEKMFTYDSVIAARKVEASKHVMLAFDSVPKPFKLIFEQKANLDKITIKDLRVVGIYFNEMELEATVDALSSSAYDTPFASITCFDNANTRLDVAGGVGAETKLVAGQSYVFKGKLQNIQYLKKGFKVVFDEEMTKW